jgi:hypothetical protein
LEAKVIQRAHAVVGNCDHIAAVTAVSAVRPALVDELLAPKRNRAVATVAGTKVDHCFIDEHGTG